MSCEEPEIERTLSALGCAPGVAQVGVLVEALEPAAHAYSRLIGIPSWAVYTYDSSSVRQLTYAGRRGDFAMRIALSPAAPVVELIEPLRGPSIYEDWLAAHPPGLHHIGVRVPAIGAAIERAAAIGLSVIQSGRGYGRDGDGGFAYLDTYDRLGIVVELLEIPARRRAPEATLTSEAR